MDRMCGLRAERTKLKMLTVMWEGCLNELGAVNRDFKKAHELLLKFGQNDIAEAPVKIVLNRGRVDDDNISKELMSILENSESKVLGNKDHFLGVGDRTTVIAQRRS